MGTEMAARIRRGIGWADGEKDRAFHLLRCIRRSPVLLGYLIVGTAVALCQEGVRGLLSAVVNLLIVGLFAMMIHRMTSGKPAQKFPVRRPKAELAAGIGVWVFLFFEITLFFNLTNIPGLQSGVSRWIVWLDGHVNDFVYRCGGPPWLAGPVARAAGNIMIELIPIFALFFVFGYGPKGMGLRPCYGKLILSLLVTSVALSLLLFRTAPLFSQPVGKTLALFALGILINGLPEELFLRGFLFPRLESVLKKPLNALVVTSLLFNALHIPSKIAGGQSVFILLDVFSLSFPSGLLWGYLYHKTRSVIPGALFHTAFGTIGSYFITF